MAPIGEIRLAIPIGIAVYHLNTASVFLVSVIGNTAPALLVLFLLKKFSPYFSENLPKKYPALSNLFTWWKAGTLKRHSAKIQKYGFVGLTLLVGIPLPFTGAYTGALLAVLMELPFKKSVPAIFTGVVISGVIVTLLVIFGVNVQDRLELQILLGAVLIFGLLYWYFKARKKRKNVKVDNLLK